MLWLKKITLTNVLEWGTYLLVFLLPMQTRWIYLAARLNGGDWEYGSNSLYGTEILLAVLVALFLVWRRKNNIKFAERNLVLLIGVFVFWSLATALWAVDYNLALYRWWLLVGGIMFYFLVAYGPAVKAKIMASLIAAAALQSVLALIQFFSQTVFGNKWLGLAPHWPADLGALVIAVGDERWLRAYGSLPHPNILAAFLLVGLVFLAGLSLTARSSKIKWSMAGAWLLILTGLFFTFSRAAAIVVIICYLIFVIWLAKEWVGYKRQYVFTAQLLAGGALVLIILAASFWPLLATRATGDGRLEVKSNQERLASYSESWQLIKIHPIVGSGLGNYTAAVYNRLDNRLPAWAYQPTHNLYLLVLAETGAVGLMMLFVICYLLFATKGTWTIKAALASLLFLGLFDHWLWSLYFGGMLWWLVAGLTIKKD